MIWENSHWFDFKPRPPPVRAVVRWSVCLLRRDCLVDDVRLGFLKCG